MTIIKKPSITEKSLSLYKNEKKVVFDVSLNATRDQVKKVVEDIYDVKVLAVRSLSRLGKKKQNRKTGKIDKKSDRKLMILQLDSKSKIEIFEGK